MEDVNAVLSGKREKHFVGIIIYLEKSFSAFRRERSIIDGQQRLTTIFLFLYAIKELMELQGMEHDAEMLEGMYLINRYDETNRFKLKPLVSDDMVYQYIVHGDIESIEEKESKVYINFVFIKRYIQEMLRIYSFDDILEALNKIYIVGVPISENDYPQKIFESINATGAKLTASDLIRNYILMPIESDRQDMFYNRYWKRIESLIDNDSKKLESFFRFFLMAKRQVLINKNAVYQAFTEWFENNVLQMTVEGVFKEIVEYAESYNLIYKADLNLVEPVLRQNIEEFRFILSDMPAPLMLELFELNKHGKIASSQLSEIVNILNSYLMRRQLCDLDTSSISRYFPTLLKEIMSGCNGDYTNIVEIFKKNLVNRNKGNAQEMPDNKKMRDRILNANMYSLKAWLAIFLRKLELENNPATVDFSKLSIEHLMPQTPTEEWLKEMGCDKETYEQNVHRLGNLTLAAKPDNSRMGNQVWGYKTRVLSSTSHIKINNEILLKSKWTLKDIEERTQHLIDEMIRLYPYFEAAKTSFERIPITIEHDLGKANAYFYPDNGWVEIQQGSVLNIAKKSIGHVNGLVSKLIDEEVVVDFDDTFVFFDNYVVYPKGNDVTALSASASIILNFSCDGMEYWRKEDGTLIGETNIKTKEAISISQSSEIGHEKYSENHFIVPSYRELSVVEENAFSSELRAFVGDPIFVSNGKVIIPVAPPSNLRREGYYIRIEYPDGHIDTNSNVWQLFVDCIMWIGPERVQSLNIYIRGTAIVSTDLSPHKEIRKRQRSIGKGIYICTYSKTIEKYRCLNYINSKLNIGLKVKLVEK